MTKEKEFSHPSLINNKLEKSQNSQTQLVCP